MSDYQSKRRYSKTSYPRHGLSSGAITSQNDATPKLINDVTYIAPRAITSQNDATPKLLLGEVELLDGAITSQNDATPKRLLNNLQRFV